MRQCDKNEKTRCVGVFTEKSAKWYNKARWRDFYEKVYFIFNLYNNDTFADSTAFRSGK